MNDSASFGADHRSNVLLAMYHAWKDDPTVFMEGKALLYIEQDMTLITSLKGDVRRYYAQSKDRHEEFLDEERQEEEKVKEALQREKDASEKLAITNARLQKVVEEQELKITDATERLRNTEKYDLESKRQVEQFRFAGRVWPAVYLIVILLLAGFIYTQSETLGTILAASAGVAVGILSQIVNAMYSIRERDLQKRG